MLRIGPSPKRTRSSGSSCVVGERRDARFLESHRRPPAAHGTRDRHDCTARRASASSKSPTGSPRPAAGALLADLGADVIKVEPPGGDVFREFLLRSMGYTHDFATNYAFQLDNRGKRSVTVALDQPGGPELVRRLAARSDVFLTNLIQQRRVRYGLTWEDVRAASPRIIYASFSGYGTRGPDENRPGFDYAAFWARSRPDGPARRAALAASALPRRPGRPHHRAQHPRGRARGAARCATRRARRSTSR